MRAGRRREAELAATVARYEEAFARIIDTCGALAVGDLESRLPALAGGSPHESALLAAVREKINGVADIADAFVREAAASLTAAQDGRFHRRFLLRGMLGAFRNAAVTINTAQTSMSDAAEHSAAGVAERAVLTDRVREVSEQVAAASTELAASSGALAVSANSAVSRADTALQTVHSLERTSAEIQQAVALIKNVAAQTRLLALNATIEAARAGDAGRGFAVVASEVKTLADEVNRSSDDIAGQVAAAQQAAGQAVTAINEIAAVIHEMDRQVAGVAIAASGDLHSGEGGLSQMAEALRAEVHQFSGTGR